MIETIFKGATRPPMKFGVPLVPLVVLLLPGFVSGMWLSTMVSWRFAPVIFGTVIIVSADTKYGEIGTLGNLTLLLAVLAALGLAVPLLAVEVRRFHDQDMSGWFALLNLIPYLGPFVVMVFMLIDGTAGENRFGTDPKRD